MTNVFPHTFNNKNSSLLYIWLLLRSVINRSICFCLYNNYGPIFQNISKWLVKQKIYFSTQAVKLAEADRDKN